MGAVVRPIASFVSPSNQQAVAQQVTAPSTAEVSQSGAANAAETIKKRRRGKSPTILTTASGAEGTPTLGTTSLLGQ